MRSLRIISDKIQDNVIGNMAYIGSTLGNYPVSHLTAGYLTQIIALLDEKKILEWQSKSKDKCPELSKQIGLTAKLYIDGYMRSVNHAVESYHTITVWLDACLYMIRDFSVDRSIHIDQNQFWKDNAIKLFDVVKKSSNIRDMSTVDLSRFAKSLSFMQRIGIIANNGDILIESCLELLYRRNKFGFFCFDAYDQSTLPLSKQFFVLDCLHECRQSTVIEIIMREALEVFSRLCSIAKNNSTGHFTFRNGEILSYSAESIGNILVGVSALLLTLEDAIQRKSVMLMLDELYCKLLSNRVASKKSAVSNANNSHLLLQNDISTHIAASLNSLFAGRVILNLSEQSIKYMSYHNLNNWQVLYLCRCLLDVEKRMKLLPKLN